MIWWQQLILAIVPTLIGHIFGQRKIAKAIERAKDDKGVVNFNDPATAKVMDASLGKVGKAIVDSVQGTK